MARAPNPMTFSVCLRGAIAFVSSATIAMACGATTSDPTSSTATPDADAASSRADAATDRADAADALAVPDSTAEDVDAGPCGPPDLWQDCNGPCGIGFSSPVCVDGAWTCPASTSGDPETMPCFCLADAWKLFASSYRSCITAEDCVLVGGAGTCNCAPALGEGSGDPIAKNMAAMAEAFLLRFAECKTDPAFAGSAICDSAPAQNLRCEQNQCTADSASCGMSDGGSAD